LLVRCGWLSIARYSHPAAVSSAGIADSMHVVVIF
jgi:hypothetical protein